MLDRDEIPTAIRLFSGVENSTVQPAIMCDIDITGKSKMAAGNWKTQKYL
jgi:hypothetical protein